MGKISAAKKKERRKDFQKVKFKVGKKLPKNLNETRATFKAKTLILKKQFTTDKEGPVSHRNLSWKDLLAHLSHHNQSIKLDALHSLKEMISANHDLIRLDLNNFLENICPLFSDRDYKVREACMQLFKTFILLPDTVHRKNSLQPFHSLLNVHLSCAMTHISENVQNDSLKLLDILVEHMADLVRNNAYTIFQNFVDQISKASLKGDRRTLKNDPYKMTSTQAWRSKVLARLFKMLQIVSSAPVLASNQWTEVAEKRRPVLVRIDGNVEIEIVRLGLGEETDRQSLKICKRLSGKRNMTELGEFFEHYFKVITPLLVDCWIEAKPEKKNVIETYESLSIMNSVMSILNLLLDNLKFNFTDLANQIRSPSSSKDLTQIKYIENLFLAQFPYCLAENFEYTPESKKLNYQLGASTINLLLCKFCSSSLLQLSEVRLLEMFKYSMDSLLVAANDQHRLELNELVTVLNLSDTIFNNFTNSGIVRPFLVALTAYFEHASKFSHNKWLVFQFLCKQFYENDNLNDYDSIFVAFFRKVFAYCVAYAKEKKEKLETLLDWLRRLVIRKEKSLKIVLTILEDEFINLLNALDFESTAVSEACKKKLLELVFWLPKINRFLFTKLAILVLKKSLSAVNTNQVLGILKLRLDHATSSNEPAFDHCDYLMFLTCLFNGASGFDLMSTLPATPGTEFFSLDCARFRQHLALCKHLENFVASHKDSENIVALILSSTIPIFLTLPSINCYTLYGSLCLIGQLDTAQMEETTTVENYANLIRWVSSAQHWAVNKLHAIQFSQLGSREEVENSLYCLNEILLKIDGVYRKNSALLNDSVPQLLESLQNSNSLDNLRRTFVQINYLLVKFGSGMRPSSDYLHSIYRTYKKGFNDANYLWWHEFCNLLKAL